MTPAKEAPTPQHDTLAAALVAALAELTVVEQTHSVDAGRVKYNYANIADVVKLTRPVLAKHGLAAMTPVQGHEGGLAVTVILLHASGERWVFDPLPFEAGKDAQATGSAITYMRRYGLLSALGMAAADGSDDDGAAATADAHKVTPEDLRVSKANAKILLDKCESLGLSVSEVVKLGTGGRTDDPYEVYKTEVPAVKEAMDNLAPAEETP